MESVGHLLLSTVEMLRHQVRLLLMRLICYHKVLHIE